MQKRLIMQLRITLKDTKPPIWRRVAVWSDTTLGELHVVIQIAMGWEFDHLHHFLQRVKGRTVSQEERLHSLREGQFDPAFLFGDSRRYFVPTTDPMGGPIPMEGEDEDSVTLAEVCPKVKSKLEYEYDFGDGWQHTIEVQKIFEPKKGVRYPVCQAGKRACPPEDCGGVWGYYDMLAILEDPNHERHEEIAEWIPEDFDPEVFDRDEVNEQLTRWWQQE